MEYRRQEVSVYHRWEYVEELGAPRAQASGDEPRGPIGPRVTPNRLDMFRRSTNVRSCNHYCLVHIKYTSSAIALYSHTVILNRKYYFNEVIFIPLPPKRENNDRYRFVISMLWISHVHPLSSQGWFVYSAVLYHAHSSLCNFEAMSIGYVLFRPLLFRRCAVLTPCCFDAMLFWRFAAFTLAV